MDSLQELLATHTTTRLIVSGVIALVTLIVLEIIRKVIIHRLRGKASTTESSVDDLVLRLARGMFGPVRLAFAIWVGTWVLVLPELWAGAIGRIGVILVAIQLGRWGGAIIDTGVAVWSKRAQAAPSSSAANVLSVVRALSRGTWWAAMALLVLENLGVDLAPLLTGLGVGGVAVALAVQSVVGDLLRSLTILFDRPAAVGELVVIGDVRGHVETIGLRSTRIRALTGEEVVVPNSDLVNARVRNFRGQPDEPVKVRLLADLTNPAERLSRLHELALATIGEASGASLIRAGIAELGPQGAVIEVVFRTAGVDDAAHYLQRQQILLSLLGRLQVAGITLLVTK